MFKILVVEDDPDLNRTVCTFLNHSGCEAVGCMNMSDADEFRAANTETAPREAEVYMTKSRSKPACCGDFEIKAVHGPGYKAVLK